MTARRRMPIARRAPAPLRLRMLAAAWSLFALLAVMATTRSARAASPPELRAYADSDTVALGDTVTVTLQALAENALPSDPQITRAAPGFSVRGMSPPQVSTQIRIFNGVHSERRGLTVSWQLRAERVGTFVVGPPSVLVGSTRVRAQPVQITVVDPARAPPRRTQPQAVNPFDPFGALQQLLPFSADDFDQPRSEEVQVDPKLALDAPRDASPFLHATVDKTRAVVGEQITFTVFLYVDVTVREPEINDVHEAPAPDFLKKSLLENESQAQLAGTALVGGRIYVAKVVRKTALFPLKSGDLDIGPMTLAIVGPRGSGRAQRQSEALRIRVSEPPMSGRPPGYVIGDVGAFSLAANVTPRTVEREGAIGVTVDLSGTGNLPSTLTPPQRPGIEWLEPQLHEKIGATAGDVLGGKRTFSYVVRLHREGDLDLGELTVPFWDPKKNVYDTARVALGAVHVTPGRTPQVADAPKSEILPGLPVLRTSRGGALRSGGHAADSPWTWLGLSLPALAYAFTTATRDVAKRLRARKAEQKTSPRAELRARILAGEAALASGDVRAIDAATSRVLEAGTVAHAGVNVRGALASEASVLLVDAGVRAEVAKQVEELLRESEAARFSGESGAGSAKERWQRALRTIDRLSERT